jgi:hypothetical protein
MKSIETWLRQPSAVPSLSSLLVELKSWRLQSTFPKFYYHPIGFIYSHLLTSDAVSMRLHIWSGEARIQQPLWDVHDHVFAFESLVLTGSIRNETFDFLPGPTPNHGIFTARYDGNESVLTSTGRFGSLCEKSAVTTPAGGTYSVSAKELHRSCAIGTFVATLLRTVTVSSTPISIIGTMEHPRRLAYRRESADPDTVRKLVDELIRTLG